MNDGVKIEANAATEDTQVYLYYGVALLEQVEQIQWGALVRWESESLLFFWRANKYPLFSCKYFQNRFKIQ